MVTVPDVRPMVAASMIRHTPVMQSTMISALPAEEQVWDVSVVFMLSWGNARRP